MRYPSIRVEIVDSKGKSSISLEKLSYRRAHKKITYYLDYILKGEEGPIGIGMEGTYGKESISRSFEDMDPAEAQNEIAGFLGYIYDVDSTLTEFMPDLHDQKLPSWLDESPEGLTQKDKVFLLLKHGHLDSWVRSQDIQKEYEIVYGDEIQLSSVSTYLARYFNQGYLERRGSRAQREYKLPADKVEA
jgi:hypothetical protein